MTSALILVIFPLFTLQHLDPSTLVCGSSSLLLFTGKPTMTSFKPFLLLLALSTCLLSADALRKVPKLAKPSRELENLYEDVLRRELQDVLNEKLFELRGSQSGVWATKLRRFARLFDSDGDGILTKAEAVGQLVQEVQSALDSETADEITDTIAEAWSSVFVIPDSGIDIDSAAILAIGNAVCNNDDRKRKLRIWARSVFSESDSDLSCKLSRAEHGLTFGMNHVTQSALAASFDAADADGSGEITKAEFLGAMIGYFCNKSEDSALFGP